MSDPSLPYIPITLSDGATVNLPKASKKDRRILLADWRTADRKRLIALLDETKMAPEQRYAELREFDDRPPYSPDTIIQRFNAPDDEGKEDAFLYLLKKGGEKDPQAILEKYDERLSAILVPAWGFTFAAPKDVEAGKSGENPPKTPAETTRPTETYGA